MHKNNPDSDAQNSCRKVHKTPLIQVHWIHVEKCTEHSPLIQMHRFTQKSAQNTHSWFKQTDSRRKVHKTPRIQIHKSHMEMDPDAHNSSRKTLRPVSISDCQTPTSCLEKLSTILLFVYYYSTCVYFLSTSTKVDVILSSWFRWKANQILLISNARISRRRV